MVLQHLHSATIAYNNSGNNFSIDPFITKIILRLYFIYYFIYDDSEIICQIAKMKYYEGAISLHRKIQGKIYDTRIASDAVTYFIKIPILQRTRLVRHFKLGMM